jgi:sulfite exporter TauE/SafE
MLSIITEAFMLGLSTGVYCFSQCGIVIVPYLFTNESNGVKKRSYLILNFLSGRFIAYILIGLIAGYLGMRFSTLLKEYDNIFKIIITISYFALSFLLIFNSFHKYKNHESCKYRNKKLYNSFPILLGLFTGVNICPPFIAAAARAFNTSSVFKGGLFFVIFFIATSIFILPLTFTGLMKNSEILRKVARITSIMAGVYLTVMGFGYLFG